MVPRAVNARDAGMALISRINRWLIAGAIGLSGLISLVAANAFHGRTVASSSSAASASSGGSAASQSQSQPQSQGSGLQQPSSTPAPAPTPAPSPAVSGGS